MPNQFLLTSSRDIRGALARLRILTAMGVGIDATRAAFSADMGAPAQVDEFAFAQTGFSQPVTDLTYYVSVLGPNSWVFIRGAENATIGQRVWNGYTGPGGIFAPAGLTVNAWAVDEFARAYTRLFAAWPFQPRVDIVSHSAGMLVARQLALLLADPMYGNDALVITSFGAPKVGGERERLFLPRGEWTNWMLSDDPVPMLPPRPSTYQRIMSGLDRWQGQRISLFVENPYGVNLRLNGTFMASNVPLDVPQPPVEALGTWLSASQAGQQTPHDLASYGTRFAAAQSPADADYTPDTDGTGGSIRTSGDTPGEIRRATQVATQTIFTDASRQNSANVKIPTNQTFTVKRINRTYWVFFGGIPIVAAPFRRRAHGLARAGNDFLRRLQNEAFVDASTFENLLSLYLVAAADPAGGFSPVMNTSL